MGSMPRRLILLLAGSLLLLAPLIGVQLATGAGRAHACSCAPPSPPLEASDGADAVFSGTVVSGGAFGFDFFWSVELEVDTVWKGSVTSTTFVYVWFGPSCGYDQFEPGKDFLVYAHEQVFPHDEDEETLFVHLCSRTRPLEYADDDLQVLGEGQASAPGGVTGALRPSSDQEQTPESGVTEALRPSSDQEQTPESGVTGALRPSSDQEQTPESGVTEALRPSSDQEQTPESGVTGALRPSSDQEQTPNPGETDAALDSRDSFRSLAWWAPLLAGLAAAALIIRRWARRRERG